MRFRPDPVTRRRRLVSAAVTVALVGCILTTWAAGGFEQGGIPWRGPERKPGETIETRFWDISVHSATMSEGRVAFSLRLHATNKQEHAHVGLTKEMIVVRLPDLRAVTASHCMAEPLGSQWQPLVRQMGTCSFTVHNPDKPEEGPRLDPPFDIEVIVVDQEMGRPLLEAEKPVSSFEAAGWVPLTVTAEDQ